MLRALRRWQPSGPPLAVLYWVALLAVAAVAILALFTLADRLPPPAGHHYPAGVTPTRWCLAAST